MGLTNGSSPRAWGTVQAGEQHRMDGRFIPTGVGNRSGHSPDRGARPVHPHGRGEQTSAIFAPSNPAGSSPRAWGTAIILFIKNVMFRFIPTGVGNSQHHRSGGIVMPVHPHGRGEQGVFSSTRSAACGSSPRAWGTAPPAQGPARMWRFIPTGVGNSPYLHFLVDM